MTTIRRLQRLGQPRRAAPARGFTLVEIIVVMVIFSILALLGYGTLNNLLRQQAVIETSLDRLALQQKAFMRLRNDLQNLRARPIRDGFGDPQPALLGSAETGIEFTRGGWRNPLNTSRSNFERVRYTLSGEKLLRSNWRVLDRAQDSAAADASLLDDVIGMRWRFMDSQLEWLDEWPSSATELLSPDQAPLPLAVELTLDTHSLGEMRFLFRVGRDASAEAALETLASGGSTNADGGSSASDSDGDGEDDTTITTDEGDNNDGDNGEEPPPEAL